MPSKTYRANSMKEALTRVRRDFGGDAIILAARQVRHRRLFGLRARSQVEVTATDSMPVPQMVPELTHNARSGSSISLDSHVQGETPVSPGPSGDVRLELLGAGAESAPSEDEFHHIGDLPSAVVAAYSQLIADDLPEFLARRLVHYVAQTLPAEELVQPAFVRRALEQAVEESIPVAPPIQVVSGTRRVVSLVGPTGAGKTTTIAKLAAALKLDHGVHIGMLSVDTYRIAAAEELKTYSEIMGLRLAVAAGPGDVPRALDELGLVDLVFIDTAGCSPRDQVKIRELAEILQAARCDEVHLVLSAVSAQRNLRAAITQFGALAVNRLILTKLDEADGLGGLLAILGLSDHPVSYLSTGQAVPEHIEPADRKRLARLILRYDALS
jgi:flagellar biosynthesis protein FlhF